MANTSTVHAQLIRYATNGDQVIVNLKSAGSDISIDRSTNTKLPTSVTTAQTLANALGNLAFKDSLSKSDVGLGSVDNTADVNKSVKYAASAGSATKLATARAINGVNFDGSGAITITANPTETELVAKDLNSITTPGMYFSGGSNTCTNKPSNVDAFGMIVFKTAAGYITQILVEGNTSAIKTWMRQYNANAWSSWGYYYNTSYKPSKSDVGLGNVDNTADSTKSVASATKLGTTAVGNTTTPVYFSDGKPVALGYTIAKSVPSNAIFTDHTYSNMTAATASAAGTAGLVPAPAAGKQTSFLRGDGTWVVPTNTTYSAFKGATSSAAGGAGLVPAPATGNIGQFLRGDGSWATPTNTTYSAGRGISVSSNAFRLLDTCTTVTDWNNATTTGWYMGSGASNGPTTANSVWYFGMVIAHNTNYVVQEVYQFTASTDAKAIPKYIRAKMNGTWGSWTDVTVQKKVPNDAKFTDTNTVYSHPNSGVTAGTYKSVTVNAQGHVTAGSNPTTLAGYGITDAAKSGHKHVIADITDRIPASKITGTLSMSNMPAGALERLYPVADDATRLKLTTNEVQNGDVVKVASTGKMYFVKDDTKLTSEDGYEVFAAGTAAAVAWANVTGKPSTFTPSSHTHSYAGSSSAGGSATSAVKLDSSAGNSTTPVYFSGGKPVALGYTIAKSVPADAVFTDHTYGNMKGASSSAAGSAGLVPAPSSGQQGLYLRGDGTWATPTNTTYGVFKAATSSAAGGTGLVPQPAAGAQGKFLRGDGTWQTPTDTNTTYSVGTTSYSGTTKLYTGTGSAIDGTMTQSAITTALNGKASSSHTHNYAGSSSAGGVANSAAKLSTARTVSGGTDVTMSFNYDGSGNSSANVGFYGASAGVGNTNNYPFHRFAKLDTIAASYTDKATTFLITQDYNGGGFGIVRIVLRTNNTGNVSSVEVKWLVRSGLSADSVQVGLYNVFGKTYADAFFKTGGSYAGTYFRAIASGARASVARTWVLVNSNEVNDTTSSDKKTSSECYASIAAAGTALHNQAYTNTISGSDAGTASYANSAGTATTASNVKDSNDGGATTFAYSKSGLDYANYTWLAAWNGKELRAVNKSQFAQASHTHNYAGSGSAGGSANSAVKLDTITAGNSTTPVYFSGGKPAACTYTLGKSVPSDAKFTDTTYSAATVSANGLMSSTDKAKLDFGDIVYVSKDTPTKACIWVKLD